MKWYVSVDGITHKLRHTYISTVGGTTLHTIVLLLFASCAERPGYQPYTSSITLLPEQLDFGEVPLSNEEQLELHVLNKGLSLLIVDLLLEEAPQLSLIGETHLEIEFLSESSVPVLFSPSEQRSYRFGLAIASNDPDTPILLVPVTGTGVEPRP